MKLIIQQFHQHFQIYFLHSFFFHKKPKQQMTDLFSRLRTNNLGRETRQFLSCVGRHELRQQRPRTYYYILRFKSKHFVNDLCPLLMILWTVF